MAGKIVPALILLFDGLKRAYESRAQEEEEDEEEEDGDDCEEALSSDEDDMDEMAPDYLDKLAEFAKTKGNESGFEVKAEIKDDDADSDGDAEESVGDLNETGLESFTTPIDDEENESAIDEYWTFKEVITGKLCWILYTIGKLTNNLIFAISTFCTRPSLVCAVDLQPHTWASQGAARGGGDGWPTQSRQGIEADREARWLRLSADCRAHVV